MIIFIKILSRAFWIWFLISGHMKWLGGQTFSNHSKFCSLSMFSMPLKVSEGLTICSNPFNFGCRNILTGISKNRLHMIGLLWGGIPLNWARMDQDPWKNQECWNIEELPQLDLMVLLSVIDSVIVLNAIYLKEYVYYTNYSWMKFHRKTWSFQIKVWIWFNVQDMQEIQINKSFRWLN